MTHARIQLTQVADDLWIYDGEVVQFLMMPFTTRMTVIRLDNNKLWIHSPEVLNPALQRELAELGDVAYLISPNKLHHLYLEQWMQAYPDALSYAAPGLIERRKDIQFHKQLSDIPEEPWAKEIDQLVFRGSPVMEEVVFFHIASRTLIVTDLIENFPRNYFTGFKKFMAAMTGVLAPNGRTPIDWRWSFAFGKARARQSVHRMLDWEPENIIVSHGECIFGDGTAFLRRSFSWTGIRDRT